MKHLLGKLRTCNELLEGILNDPDLMKILAEGKDGEDEYDELCAANRTIRDCRLSARFQLSEGEETQQNAG